MLSIPDAHAIVWTIPGSSSTRRTSCCAWRLPPIAVALEMGAPCLGQGGTVTTMTPLASGPARTRWRPGEKTPPLRKVGNLQTYRTLWRRFSDLSRFVSLAETRRRFCTNVPFPPQHWRYCFLPFVPCPWYTLHSLLFLRCAGAFCSLIFVVLRSSAKKLAPCFFCALQSSEHQPPAWGAVHAAAFDGNMSRLGPQSGRLDDEYIPGRARRRATTPKCSRAHSEKKRFF